ncbi:MAG TPA: hypothetical protein VH302_03640 [Bryobacteraceae bacterium]|nr:hypothetical protein [Bryobacteraceae bacterium]
MTRRTAIKSFTAAGCTWKGLSLAQDAGQRATRTGDTGTYDEEFERNAREAKTAGVSHVLITEDFPPALWQFDTPGDPYPVWFIYHPALLKIFPPAAMQRYVNTEYAESVAGLFQRRCEILRRHGLKAAYSTNEPSVLPEAFFSDFPQLRGPRVDQPNRSRKAHFSPCVDRPEVLALYRQSMRQLLNRCPEVEIFFLPTSDAGSGLCWAPSLYPGSNGPVFCQGRPMQDRVTGFLSALHEAAKDSGHDIQADLVEIAPRQWMLPTFDRPQLIARALPAGMAVDHFEAPDGHRVTVRRFSAAEGEFAPVLGIPRPVEWARALSGGQGNVNSKLVMSFDGQQNLDLGFRVLERLRSHPSSTRLETLSALHDLAAETAGARNADDQLELWLALDDAERYLGTLNFGPVLTMGCVLTRWVTRPFVPYPAELTHDEAESFRPFLLQAKGEEEAGDLIDIQAMRMYEGWGARLLVQNIIEKVTAATAHALVLTQRICDRAGSDAAKWELLTQRIKTVQCFVRTVGNAVEYQAGLDRAKASKIAPQPDPVLGTRSGWDRDDLLNIARNEIDNAAELRRLLETTKQRLVDTAPLAREETARRLGPALPVQLKHKIDVMNAHWEDYKRLFTSPNP